MYKRSLGWGFECGDGWYWLIDQLSSCIYSYVTANPHKMLEMPQVSQIKEKYSSLRYYYVGGDERISGMVWLAEHLSGSVCEACGTTDGVSINDSGYLRALCASCRAAQEAEMQTRWRLMRIRMTWEDLK